MAKYDLKFLDITGDTSNISVEHNPDFYDESNPNGFISISLYSPICTNENDEEFNGTAIVWLDKSTAIKFAKTLRTEINKIESEVRNG